MTACTPRRRYAEREAAEREAAEREEAARWKDPFTPLERWFARLPNVYLEDECHCGSGKPVLYWSPEDGTGCEDCRASIFVYIPAAVMFNIMEKFGIPEDIRKKVYEQVENDGGRERD